MSEKLTGRDLHDRAAELEIEGRSALTADELREAIEAIRQTLGRAGNPLEVNDAETEAEVVERLEAVNRY